MKKVIFVLVALMALAFTGCKVETSEVTISVEDKLGTPLKDRYVFYADVVSVVLDAALPSPEELVTDMSDAWDVAKTNAYGVVTLKIDLGVKELSYYFMTYDYGKMDWEIKTVKLERGKNADIELVVNQ